MKREDVTTSTCFLRLLLVVVPDGVISDAPFKIRHLSVSAF